MVAAARRATGRDEAFCLDVVQDAMLRVVRAIRTLETEEHLRSWLRVVVQSCAYDRLRQEARRCRREQAAADRSNGTGEHDELDERVEWLRRELATLDAPQVRLLVLRYRLGWTLQRIGTALGLKPGAVDGRIARLVTMLRRRAKEHFDE